MHRRHALKLLSGFALCPLCASGAFGADAHWSYEGAEGPASLGRARSRQPRLLRGGAAIAHRHRRRGPGATAALRTVWDKRADTIVNNGHTIQLNMGETSVLANGKWG